VQAFAKALREKFKDDILALLEIVRTGHWGVQCCLQWAQKSRSFFVVQCSMHKIDEKKREGGMSGA
jgi:hypothetical protein